MKRWINFIISNSIIFYGAYLGIYENNIIASRLILFYVWFAVIIGSLALLSYEESIKVTPKNIRSNVFRYVDNFSNVIFITLLVGGGWIWTASFYTLVTLTLQILWFNAEESYKNHLITK